MNEMLKALYVDDTGITKRCPKVYRKEYVMTEREEKVIAELEQTLDESQKLLLEKLLDMHRTSCHDHGEETFIAGARTAAKLIIELITDD